MEVGAFSCDGVFKTSKALQALDSAAIFSLQMMPTLALLYFM